MDRRTTSQTYKGSVFPFEVRNPKTLTISLCPKKTAEIIKKNPFFYTAFFRTVIEAYIRQSRFTTADFFYYPSLSSEIKKNRISDGLKVLKITRPRVVVV